MKSAPLISIIVPIYNSEAKLSRCIDSLLAQDYTKIEVVLVNDGSSDSSLSIAVNYSRKDSRIKVFNQKNSGVSSARNLGLSEATGDFICFVDSDDYVEPNYVSNFIIGLDSDVDLVFQGLNEIHLDNSIRKIIPEQAYYTYNDILNGISDINRHKMFGYVCNKLYKASIIKCHNLKFREDISLSEDRIFALRYLHYVNNMQVIGSSAYNYELQETGLTLRHRTFEDLKKAADVNLQEALSLLSERESIRFEHDTRRMYVMSALSYLASLFQDQTTWNERVNEISSLKKSYQSWLKEYIPINRNQKLIFHSLKYPTILSVLIQSAYWHAKSIYERITKLSKH